MKHTRRLTACLLTLALCLSLAPVGAVADVPADTTGIYTQPVADTQYQQEVIDLVKGEVPSDFAVYFIAGDASSILSVKLADSQVEHRVNNCYFDPPADQGGGVWRIALKPMGYLPQRFALFVDYGGEELAIQEFSFSWHRLRFQEMYYEEETGEYVPWGDEPLDALEVMGNEPDFARVGYFCLEEDNPIPLSVIQAANSSLTGIALKPVLEEGEQKDHLARVEPAQGGTNAFCGELQLTTLQGDHFSMPVYGWKSPTLNFFTKDTDGREVPLQAGDRITEENRIFYGRVSTDDWDGGQTLLDVYKSGATPDYVTCQKESDGLFRFEVDLERAGEPADEWFDLYVGLRFHIGIGDEAIVQMGRNIGLNLTDWAVFSATRELSAHAVLQDEVNVYACQEFYLILKDRGPASIKDWAVTDGEDITEVDYDPEGRVFTIRVKEDFIRDFRNSGFALEWTNVGEDGQEELGGDGRGIGLFSAGLAFWGWKDEGAGWYEDLNDRGCLRVPFNTSPGAVEIGGFYLMDSRDEDPTPHLCFPREGEGAAVTFVTWDEEGREALVEDAQVEFLDRENYKVEAWTGREGALARVTFPRRELDAQVRFAAKSGQTHYAAVHSGLSAAAFFPTAQWDDTQVFNGQIPFQSAGETDTFYLVFRPDWGSYKLTELNIWAEGDEDWAVIQNGEDIQLPEQVDAGETFAVPIQVTQDAPTQFTLKASWKRQDLWYNGEGETWEEGQVQEDMYELQVRKNGLGFLFWDGGEAWVFPQGRFPSAVLRVGVNNDLNGTFCWIENGEFTLISPEDPSLDTGRLTRVQLGEGEAFSDDPDTQDQKDMFARYALPRQEAGAFPVTYRKDGVTHTLNVRAELGLAGLYTAREAAVEAVPEQFVANSGQELYFLVDQDALEAQNIRLENIHVEGDHAWLEPVEDAEGAYTVTISPWAPEQFYLRISWDEVYLDDEGQELDRRNNDTGCAVRHPLLYGGDPQWVPDEEGNNLATLPRWDSTHKDIYTSPGNITWVAVRTAQGNFIQTAEANFQVDGPFQLILADTDPAQRLAVGEGGEGVFLGIYCTRLDQAREGRLYYTDPEGVVFEAPLYCGLGDGSFYYAQPAMEDLEQEADQGYPSLFAHRINAHLVVTQETAAAGIYFALRPDMVDKVDLSQIALAEDSRDFATLTPVEGKTGLYKISLDYDKLGDGRDLRVVCPFVEGEEGSLQEGIFIRQYKNLPLCAVEAPERAFDKEANKARCWVEYNDASGVTPLLFCAFYDDAGNYLGARYQPQPFGKRGGWEAEVEMIPGASYARFFLTNNTIQPYAPSVDTRSETPEP